MNTSGKNTGLLALTIATGTEFVGLVVWLELVKDEQHVLGVLALVIGLVLERIAVVITARSMYGDHPLPKNFNLIQVFTAIAESAAWIIWLIVAQQISHVLGMILLGVFQLFLHSGQLAYATNRRPLFQDITDLKTIIFSAVEAFGAFLWLLASLDENLVLAAIILLVTLIVEHIIQGIVVEENKPIFE